MGKYLIIHKYEIVMFMNKLLVVESLFLWKVRNDNQIPTDSVVINLIASSAFIFGEVNTLEGQNKFHFVIPYLFLM